MKMNYLLIMILMTICFLVPGEARGEPGIPVEVLTVTLHTLKENIRAMGEVKALQDIKVSSQYSGRVIHLNTRLGAYIRQNDVIADIRKKEAEALFSSGNRIMKDIKIFSPISGYVVENYIFPGEIAVAGNPLTRIISSKKIYIKINIPGEFLHKVKKGTFLTIMEKGKKYQTKIETIVPVTDPVTGTFHAIAPLETQDLYPGTVCRITIHVSQKTVPAIPREAILTQEGKPIVFVVSKGRAERRIIKTGIRTDELIEIKKGITIGESVAVVGNYELSDRVKVTVKHP